MKLALKPISWKIYLGYSLIVSSIILYTLHFTIFHDPHHIFIYMLGDIAFVPIEVLLVTLIIHQLLEEARMAATIRCGMLQARKGPMSSFRRRARARRTSTTRRATVSCPVSLPSVTTSCALIRPTMESPATMCISRMACGATSAEHRSATSFPSL